MIELWPNASAIEGRNERRIKRGEDEALLEEMAKRVAANGKLMVQRKELVEHVFGTLKRSMNQGYFLLRTRKRWRRR